MFPPAIFIELTSIEGPLCYVAPQHIIAIDRQELQLQEPVEVNGTARDSILGTVIMLGEAAGRVFVREEPKVVYGKIDQAFNAFNEEIAKMKAAAAKANANTGRVIAVPGGLAR